MRGDARGGEGREGEGEGERPAEEGDRSKETKGVIVISKHIPVDTNEPDPFTSAGRQAEREAFAARQRMIWIGIVLAVVLAVVGAVVIFR
jgi:hypothetical protein